VTGLLEIAPSPSRLFDGKEPLHGQHRRPARGRLRLGLLLPHPTVPRGRVVRGGGGRAASGRDLRPARLRSQEGPRRGLRDCGRGTGAGDRRGAPRRRAHQLAEAPGVQAELHRSRARGARGLAARPRRPRPTRPRNAGVRVVEKDGDAFWVTAREERFAADLVVHGARRVPDLDRLGLEAGRVRREERGVSVDEHLQSGLILGAHLLGHHAEEVIDLFALAIRHGIPATELAELPSPTRRTPRTCGTCCEEERKTRDVRRETSPAHPRSVPRQALDVPTPLSSGEVPGGAGCEERHRKRRECRLRWAVAFLVPRRSSRVSRSFTPPRGVG
jgi:hypothetical protein